jgi:hypothetical protein
MDALDLVHKVTENIQKLDQEYLQLECQEKSLWNILKKLQSDQSCLQQGIDALADGSIINKRPEDEEAVLRLRQALMEDSSGSSSSDAEDHDAASDEQETE